MAARVRRDLDQHSESAAKARQAAASLESVHGRIEALLAEIRARAQELLSAAPATAACPVCGATYGEGELQKRLQHQATHIATPELQQAHSELSKLQKQQKRLNRVLRDLDTLVSIGRDAMGLAAPAAEPVSKLVASIMFLERGIAQCDLDISRLEQYRGQLQAKGFNVEELQYLNGELSRLSQDMSLGDEAQLLIQLEEMTSKQKVAAAQVDRGAKALAAEEEKTQAVLTQYDAAGDATVETVTTRMAKISGTIELLSEISETLAIDADRPLTKVAVDLDALRQAVEGFVRLKQQEESVVKVIAENEKKIAVSRDILEHEGPVCERLRSAVAVLEGLQLEHSAEKYLEGFFSENLHQISDLFCAMHAPRDFYDVVWEPDNPMAIRPVRKSTNAACSVAELSSGQRNALALAIFLTMNRKITQAPSLILLDDPVAHVDDLNIVSFLDCLRELLSGCKRQVFFATASAKAAHLFKRKFDYRGEEAFRSFHLAP
jgi:DNA repair protein SbcC/Rad50